MAVGVFSEIQKGDFCMVSVLKHLEIVLSLQKQKSLHFGSRLIRRFKAPITIEGDSLSIIKMAKKEWEHPWYLSNFLEGIWENLAGFDTRFQHTFREGNKVADLLANHGYEEMDIQFFDNAPVFIKPALFDDNIGTKFLRRYSASLPPD